MIVYCVVRNANSKYKVVYVDMRVQASVHNIMEEISHEEAMEFLALKRGKENLVDIRSIVANSIGVQRNDVVSFIRTDEVSI